MLICREISASLPLGLFEQHDIGQDTADQKADQTKQTGAGVAVFAAFGGD